MDIWFIVVLFAFTFTAGSMVYYFIQKKGDEIDSKSKYTKEELSHNDEESKRKHVELHDVIMPDIQAEMNRTTDLDTKKELKRICRDMKKIMNNLYTPALDHGLFEALENEIGRLKCRVVSNIDDTIDLGKTGNEQIHRFVREAITNVIKHSMATIVEITFIKEGQTIFGQIKDNGIGINEENLFSNSGNKNGLFIMKDRVESIGGEFQLLNNYGCEINFWVKNEKK